MTTTLWSKERRFLDEQWIGLFEVSKNRFHSAPSRHEISIFTSYNEFLMKIGKKP